MSHATDSYDDDDDEGRRLFSVFAITERRDMGLYEVPSSMSLLGLRMGTMLANFYMCGFMFVLRVVSTCS